jgi:hypothetical protein
LVKYAHTERARKIGIKMKSKKIGLWHALHKLTLETYIDTALATFLMMYAFTRLSNGKLAFF